MKTMMPATRKNQPGFLQVLAGEPSESEIEDHYLAFARLLLRLENTDKKVA